MVQYYTLEEAAKVLGLDVAELKRMADRGELRAFRDRGTMRFRSPEVDEMACRRGMGANPSLALGPSVPPRPAEPAPPAPPAVTNDGGQDIFNFQVGPGPDEIDFGEGMLSGGSASAARQNPPSSKKPAASPKPMPRSDSEVRLVADETTGASSRSSRVRRPESHLDSGVRLVPPGEPSDSAARLSGDSGNKRSGLVPTEEIDLDAELRQAGPSSSRPRPSQVKPRSQLQQPQFPATSPFELSSMDVPPLRPSSKVSGLGSSPPASGAGRPSSKLGNSPAPAAPDGGGEFANLPPHADDEINLGKVRGGGMDSGINLQDPADSGISLEKSSSSDEDDFELSLDAGLTPAPAPASSSGPKSDSDFELSLDAGMTPAPTSASSSGMKSDSDFELSLDAGMTPAPSQEAGSDSDSEDFELSLDAEGTPRPTSGSDAADESESEFELTLNDSDGAAPLDESTDAEQERDIFETDFDVPAIDEESGGAALEGDTDLGSSDFDLEVDAEDVESDDMSKSQVVALADEEEPDDSSSQVMALDDEEGNLVSAADEDDNLVPAGAYDDEEDDATARQAPAEAKWGAIPALLLLPCVLVMFVVGVMGYEMIRGMWGYQHNKKVYSPIVNTVERWLPSGSEGQ